ncbi:Uncharacterized protein Adt_41133 [Abeliophyllum distichum]|uniref:Peroxidase n=1 Tax=Abeliophyllum distichum TaxID=126358 RepID=A0ABD1PMZ9_9LAMI
MGSLKFVASTIIGPGFASPYNGSFDKIAVESHCAKGEIYPQRSKFPPLFRDLQGDLSLFDAVDGSPAAKTAVSRCSDAGRVGDATLTSSLIRLENMDVEGCRNLNELMSLEK